MPSPWTLKDGSNSGAPPGIFGPWNRRQLQSMRLKIRINGCPRRARAKEKPAGLSRRASGLPQRGERGCLRVWAAGYASHLGRRFAIAAAPLTSPDVARSGPARAYGTLRAAE